jgi:hypothetical protein
MEDKERTRFKKETTGVCKKKRKREKESRKELVDMADMLFLISVTIDKKRCKVIIIYQKKVLFYVSKTPQ